MPRNDKPSEKMQRILMKSPWDGASSRDLDVGLAIFRQVGAGLEEDASGRRGDPVVGVPGWNCREGRLEKGGFYQGAR